MQGLAPSEIFQFEDFRLDRRGGLSRRDDSGAFVPVAIGSRALDILGVLIARAGEVVSKEDIITAVWPETVVEDSNLTVQISALRRLLDQYVEDVECARTDRDRDERAGVITPKQAAAPVEAEVLELKNCRRSEPLHARSPATTSEAYTEARPPRWVKALNRRDFGTFRKISEDFIANSLPCLHRRSS